MKKWSIDPRFQQTVQFLTACVELASCALSFHRMFDFGDSSGAMINGYIPSGEYMPRGYGQLGCSGFVVSDNQGRFVSR